MQSVVSKHLVILNSSSATDAAETWNSLGAGCVYVHSWSI